jgi:hypothetical protein
MEDDAKIDFNLPTLEFGQDLEEDPEVIASTRARWRAILWANPTPKALPRTGPPTPPLSDLPADWVQLKFPKYSLLQIEEEKKIAYSIQEGESYDENPVDIDIDGNETEGAGCSLSVLDSPAVSEWSRSSARRGYRWPEERALRNAYTWQTIDGVTWGLGGKVGYRSKKVYGSLWDDYFWSFVEKRQQVLLRWMGRQRYTDWRVACRRISEEKRESYPAVMDFWQMPPQPAIPPAPPQQPLYHYYDGGPVSQPFSNPHPDAMSTEAFLAWCASQTGASQRWRETAQQHKPRREKEAA